MKKFLLSLFSLISVQVAFSQTLKEGVALLEGDNIVAARNAFQDILKQDPKNAGAWFYLGEIFYNDDNMDSASLCYKKALEVNPESYFSYIGTGTLLLDKNKPSDAEKAFAKAKKEAKDKELPEVLALIGSAYLKARSPNFDKAAASYLAARDLDTKNARYFVGYGDALLAQGNVGEALTSYELASNKDRENPEILMKIARAYYKNGIQDVAIEQLEGSIQRFPNYAPAYKELYQLYFQKGQYSKVTPLLEKYVSLVGNDTEQRARLVKFLVFQAKDYKRAIQEAFIVLEQQPTHYPMHRWLAWAYYEDGDYKASLEMSKLFFKHAGSRPIYASDHEYYAKAAAKLNLADEAIVNYKKVVELDSSRTDMYDLIAKALYDAKRWPEAETGYLDKMQKSRSNSQDWYYLGMSRYQQGKNLEADSAFAKLNEIQPTYATGWLMRARCNNRLDPDRKSFQAKPFFDKYIELASSDTEKNKKQLVEAYNYIGYYLSQHNDFAGSTTWYQKSMGLDPANEEAKNALEQLRAANGGK